MTIVSEINAIVTENGGTASTDGTIIGALDALADTLAGENVDRGASITQAIHLLGEYITSGWELLAQQDVTVSTTSTSQIDVTTVTATGLTALRNSGSKTIIVYIFDKEGIRAGCFYGSTMYQLDVWSNTGDSYYAKSDGTIDITGNQYGVFPYIAANGDTITIRARCVSGKFEEIDSTFDVRVYALDFPSGFAPFDVGE